MKRFALLKDIVKRSQAPVCKIVVWTLVLTSLAMSDSVQASRRRPPTQDPYVINNKRYYPIPSSKGYREKGLASWYGQAFHGRNTSNGETYNMHAMTAAHKTLPMNTMLLVKNLESGKKTVVRINDRGPFVRGRIIDLSYKAAKKIDVVANGTARVQIVALAEGTVSSKNTQPNLLLKDLSIGEFYVQIGAFSKKINAIRLQKRFTDAGHTTVIQKYYGPQSILYRVQVYAGKTLQHAQRSEKALLNHGYVGSFIIAR